MLVKSGLILRPSRCLIGAGEDETQLNVGMLPTEAQHCKGRLGIKALGSSAEKPSDSLSVGVGYSPIKQRAKLG